MDRPGTVPPTIWTGGAYGRSAGSVWLAPGRREPLEMYQATVSRAQVAKLAREGYDIAATRSVPGGVQVDLVLSDAQRARLEGQGSQLGLKRNRDGLTSRQLAAQQAAGGYTVWRSFEQPGGIRDELYTIARANPRL